MKETRFATAAFVDSLLPDRADARQSEDFMLEHDRRLPRSDAVPSGNEADADRTAFTKLGSQLDA